MKQETRKEARERIAPTVRSVTAGGFHPSVIDADAMRWRVMRVRGGGGRRRE